MPSWYLTSDSDKSLLALYRRHYSANPINRNTRHKVSGPGNIIALRTFDCSAGFIWRLHLDQTINADKPGERQRGVECSFFRNESPETFLSSDLIREADTIADFIWPGSRHYTKVDPSRIGQHNPSSNPGYCFKCAGWHTAGRTKGGLLILEKIFSLPSLSP